MIARFADPTAREKQAEVARKLHRDQEFVDKHKDGCRRAVQKFLSDPVARAEHSERGRRTMMALNANPDFAKARDESSKRTQANPKFAAARDERMHKLWERPEFRRAHVDMMRKRNADPSYRAKLFAARRGLDVQIPSWVPQSLHVDYLDFVEVFGEEDAASRVRALKREMI